MGPRSQNTYPQAVSIAIPTFRQICRYGNKPESLSCSDTILFAE
jgi:hypothetical protein